MKLNFGTLLHSKNIVSAFQKQELLFHPSREWMSGLLLAVFFFGMGIFFIALDFYTQFYVPEEDVEVPVQTIEYRAKEVQLYAEKYNVKAQTFNTLRENREFVPAPVAEEVTATGTVSEIAPVENTSVQPLADDAREQ